jgi:hypothetical protein
MKLNLDRSTWSFGKGHTNTFLLHNGKKDVLGFFAMACGATEDQLLGRVMLVKDGPAHYANDLSINDLPSVPEEIMPLITDSILFYVSDMNDAPHLSERDREWLIIEGFSKMKVKVTFIGEYPKNMESGI